MPTIYVKQNSQGIWQYKGDTSKAKWVDFAPATSPATLTFRSGGTLDFSADNSGLCTNVRDAGTTTSITVPGTGYSAVAKCGSGTATTGYFSAGSDSDDIAP